jgi:hypothetical protein
MTPEQRLYLVLADLILILHAAFVAFVVFGLLLIWIGRFRRWKFVRNFWFRMAHLAAIGVVTAQSVGGVVCPLTTLEDRLRLLGSGEERYQESFIEHRLQQVLFFDVGESFFALAYIVFLGAVVLCLWLVPPRWPVWSRKGLRDSNL